MWIRKSPFGRHEDAAQHMLALLVTEAQVAGTPLNDAETELLAAEAIPGRALPEELRQRVKKVIERIREADRATGAWKNPKSFTASLEWAADDPLITNVVALTEEVFRA